MSLPKEYIIFCDESDRKGRYFSNFYGGVMVDSNHWDRVSDSLLATAKEHGITSEIKWSKVGPIEARVYLPLMQSFFQEIQAGNLKMRVMFRQNAHVPQKLSSEQKKQEYFLLYHQFIKHGFGLAHMPDHSKEGVNLRLYLDKLPLQNKEGRARFRGYLSAIAKNATHRKKGLQLRSENITEVDSKDHILLQCMDVVLGSISFRLNDKHKIKPKGQRVRGKRTRAKEELYKAILSEIQKVTNKKHFNIGISTKVLIYPEGRWHDPYLHWSFKSKETQFDPELTKPK